MYRIDWTDNARKSITLTFFALFLLMCIFSLMIGSTFHIPEPADEYLGISAAAETLQQRTQFLKDLGFSPDESSEEHEDVTIPTVFGDVYTRYNELQKQSGGDLSLYKGARCTRYTYIDSVSGEHLDLLVYNGKIIGGDVCTVALDGEMRALAMENGKWEMDNYLAVVL